MNFRWINVLEEPLVEALGWTLLHFLWQGAVIAGLLWLVLRAMPRPGANARYTAACAALLLTALAPLVTLKYVLSTQPAMPGRNATELGSGGENELTADNSATATAATISINQSKRRHPATPFREWISPALPWLVGGWFATVIALSIRLGIGWCLLRRIRKNSREPLDPAWDKTLERLTRDLKLTRPVALFKSAWVEVPTVIGWLKPAILFPTTALTGLTPEQLETILAHELAHVRRHDYLVNLFQSVVETLLFYHPAVWWVSRQARHERELCCDEIAVEVCGNRLAYARALATLEELRAVPLPLGIAAGAGSLVERIRRLVCARPEPSRSSWWVVSNLVVTVVLLSSVATQSLRSALAENPTAILELNQPAGQVADRLLFGLLETDPQNPGKQIVRPIAPKLGEYIQEARVQPSIFDGRPEIFVRFNAEGAELLGKVTEQHMNQQLAIIFRGRTLTAPIIREKIPGGQVVISGKFTAGEAGEIAEALNRGKALNSRQAGEAPNQPELRAATPSALEKEPPSNAAATALAAPSSLLTRTFRVDPNTFLEAIAKTLPKDRPLADPSNPQALVRAFVAAVGVEFRADESATNQHRRAIYFNDRSGVLFVRATSEELDVIEKAIQVANQSPAQVIIEAKFVELTGTDAKALGWDWFVTTTNASGVSGEPVSVSNVRSDTNPNSKATRIVGSLTGILTRNQYHEAMRSLEHQPGSEVLAAPIVTTLSGRSARIAVSEVREVAPPKKDKRGDPMQNAKPTNQEDITQVPVGPSVDVTPFVSADGKSIRLDVAAKVVEYLGPEGGDGRIKSERAAAASRFRVREAAGTASILDGQTIVLSGMPIDETVLTRDKVPVLGDLPILGRLFRREGTSTRKKHLLVFVTAATVDAAGNLLHSGE